MEMAYKAQDIERKWQKIWEENSSFRAKNDKGLKKMYILEMFPYPSGNLHMGHVRCYVIGDLLARFYRMKGFNVLHPMGWDSLGLPAENAAIKEGIMPQVRTPENIANVKKQMKMLGLSYDWEREIATYKPEYYKWNQYLFLKFYEKGLVYKKRSLVNYCPSCKTVLANEQVIEQRCWRCDTMVTQKEVMEWAFRITKYAEELLRDIERLEGWPDRVKLMQKNWIGRSEGAYVDFEVAEGIECIECSRPVGVQTKREKSKQSIRVFTTRIDTIFGATYLVLAPEHPIVESIVREDRKKEVRDFVEKVKMTDRIERTNVASEKEGVFTGAYAINPFTKRQIPIYIANFVLPDYGTGAVMSVPAHDQRDFLFAKKYGLPIKTVIKPKDGDIPEGDKLDRAFEEHGIMINSGEFSGLTSEEGKVRLVEYLKERGLGEPAVTYHLRDWGFSRQRYWGTPIPIVYCERCGEVPVPYDELPVVLPENVPLTGKDEAPLSHVPEFVNTKCPSCSGPAQREVETMDTFVDSAWYFARYVSPHNDKAPFDKEWADYWLPIDIYVGGPEHAVLHLLYFRFFTKAMRDIGLLSIDEPATKLLTQGIVYKDGFKMSKSKGNVVSPDDMVARYGADSARLFSLFAAPPEKDLEWSDQGIEGSFRFLNRIFNFTVSFKESFNEMRDAYNNVDYSKLSEEEATLFRVVHKTIKRVLTDIEEKWQFNTAIAALMEMYNSASSFRWDIKNRKETQIPLLSFLLRNFLLMLYPFAPHLASELFSNIFSDEDISRVPFPSYEDKYTIDEKIPVVIQVNGKLRSQIE
ncbi:MAG: leucine--tRNA ligase, partial [Deltaproteobacteria bacterium]|nr:leucine--tRNA ligase [Deltaproteobacteria bacterium]